MKETIFEFVNQYAVWGILIITFFAALLLWRMQLQLRRLNRNLGTITGNIQQYFNVILKEDEEPQPAPVREFRREERFLTKEERDILLQRKKETGTEDEAVLHAVIQEYFS